MEKYDVVVVGAGPAGSTAARYAAAGGAKVLILERDREPGIPVRCGEGVSENGISEFIEPNPKWISAEIKDARIHSPNGESAFLRNNGKGYILDRRLFDAELCKIACDNGAEIQLKADAQSLKFVDSKISGINYIQFGEQKSVDCDIVISADGVESRVARWAGIDTKLSLYDLHTSIMYTVQGIDILANTTEFYFDNKFAPGGYVWVFPKSKNSANIGVGIGGSRIGHSSAKEYLDKFMAAKFPKGKISYIVCGGIPTAKTLDTLVIDNLMVVGDAAHQLNPLTGGGIMQGMIAGKLAGTTAAEAVKKQDFSQKFLNKYDKAWQKRMGKVHKILHSLKDRLNGMSDQRYNDLIKYCQDLPADKSSIKVIFIRILKDNPRMVLEAAKSFVMSKIV